MQKEYNLATLKKRQNTFAKRLKKQITIRIGAKTIEYFKNLSEETGIPYQNLIDSYLSDCAEHHRKIHTKWE
jgi:predicted DNA binding CopG/RHH family protein